MTYDQQPPRSPALDPPARRWVMLGLVTLGFIAMAVNWFNISTGFDAISKEFDVEILAVALLISLFVAAYGLLHIPGGFLATRWGLRSTLALGMGLEGIGALLSAGAGNYLQLVLFRLIAGAGASVFAAVGIAAVTVWFREKNLAVALGISSTGFSIGTALGLYGWGELTAALGWRWSVALGGVFGLLVALAFALAFRVPAGATGLSGVRLSRAGLRRALGDRQVWLFGFAFIGAYGAYIAGSQLVATFGEGRGISGGQIAAAAFLIGIAGVPGSIVGGVLAERYISARRLFVIGAVGEGAFLILLPLVGDSMFWLPAMGIGFMFNFTFAVWQTIPGDIRTIAPEDIGTAVGLMLTVSAIGGFLVPYVYGVIATAITPAAAWIFLGGAAIVLGLVALASPLLEGGTAPAEETGRRAASLES